MAETSAVGTSAAEVVTAVGANGVEISSERPGNAVLAAGALALAPALWLYGRAIRLGRVQS